MVRRGSWSTSTPRAAASSSGCSPRTPRPSGRRSAPSTSWRRRRRTPRRRRPPRARGSAAARAWRPWPTSSTACWPRCRARTPAPARARAGPSRRPTAGSCTRSSRRRCGRRCSAAPGTRACGSRARSSWSSAGATSRPARSSPGRCSPRTSTCRRGCRSSQSCGSSGPSAGCGACRSAWPAPTWSSTSPRPSGARRARTPGRRPWPSSRRAWARTSCAWPARPWTSRSCRRSWTRRTSTWPAPPPARGPACRRWRCRCCSAGSSAPGWSLRPAARPAPSAGTCSS
mmetsp:Transcript_92218/g.298572  ORF Transcript_92218/g.298572 Transcript_92218/m.298572 type:complete len:286 (+) Transcript_92218:465-1322(+)